MNFGANCFSDVVLLAKFGVDTKIKIRLGCHDCPVSCGKSVHTATEATIYYLNPQPKQKAIL